MKKAEIVKLKKDLVDSLLDMNTGNRPVKKSVVERYERDIKAGSWVLTGQGISVSEDGVLLDGQHRLLAIRNSGYPPVEVVLVTGLDQSSQKVIDQHAKRSARDVFGLTFDVNVSHHAPAILSSIFRFEPRCSEFLGFTPSQRNTPTVDELYELFDAYGENVAAVIGMVVQRTFFPAPVLAASVCCIQHDGATREQIKTFIDQVRTGENLSRKMPAYHLRNMLMTTRNTSGGGIAQQERFHKTVRAINAFMTGVEMGVLRA